MEIRPVLKDDIPGIKSILDSTLLFPSAYLDEMIADYFTNSESRDIWFVSVDTDKITSFGYCGPERITDGTYNLYAIAVLNESQGKGIGTRMMGFIENKLRESGHRILLVETSAGTICPH